MGVWVCCVGVWEAGGAEERWRGGGRGGCVCVCVFFFCFVWFFLTSCSFFNVCVSAKTTHTHTLLFFFFTFIRKNGFVFCVSFCVLSFFLSSWFFVLSFPLFFLRTKNSILETRTVWFFKKQKNNKTLKKQMKKRKNSFFNFRTIKNAYFAIIFSEVKKKVAKLNANHNFKFFSFSFYL